MENLEFYLEAVEQQLSRFIPSYFDGTFLDSYIGSTPSAPWDHYNSLLEPVRDIIARGGKRWRAVLLLLVSNRVCKDFGGAERRLNPRDPMAQTNPMTRPNPVDYALPLVSLIELVHGGTLVVDDIEDKSDTRRGDTAIHLKYGEDIAINSGNFMYLAPLRIIEQYSAEVRVQLYEIYQRLLTRLHLGQGLDIYWHRNPEIVPTKEQYYEMTRLKTGSLARMATEMGVALGLNVAGRERSVIEDWEPTLEAAKTTELEQKQSLDKSVCLKQSFGELADSLGVAFQIQDDLLNITQGIKGKDFGDDLIEGKKSLPLILAVEKQPEIAADLLSCIQDIQKLSGEPRTVAIQKAIDLITSVGGVEQAGVELTRVKGEIQQTMETLPWSVESKQEFTRFIQHLLG